MRKNRRTGFTLVEMMVAVGLLIIFMAAFTGISVTLMQTLTISNSNAKSGAEQMTTLEILAMKSRYADSINIPGAGSTGTIYVELRSPAGTATDGSTDSMCTQFRYSSTTKSIASRTWINGTTPTDSWRFIAKGRILPVTNTDSTTYPFTVNPIGSNADMQSLTIAYHEGTAQASTFMSKTVNALNSNTDAHSEGTVCTVSGTVPRP
jgi:type II secretory pathway pseudopilin PulG